MVGFITRRLSTSILTLLLVSGNVPWSELVFPAWSLVLSLYILLAGGRSRPPAASRA